MNNQRPPQPVFTIILEMSTIGRRPSVTKRFSIAAPDEKTALMKAFIHAKAGSRCKVLDHRVTQQPAVYW